MIHYHGTPLGGKRLSVAEFVRGRNFLIPYPRQEDLGIVAESAQGFVFDNGAFSAWKQDKVIDWRGYSDWCQEWAMHPRFHWALIPDVIDGSEEENDALLVKWSKWTKAKVDSVPVWHLNESFERLERLMRGYPRVALGSSGDWSLPGSDSWHRRIGDAMRVLCDEDGKPKTRIHGLRMLSPRVVECYPFASADSTNVAQNKELLARFGMYCPPTSDQRAAAIAARIEAINSPATFNYANQPKQLDFLELGG